MANTYSSTNLLAARLWQMDEMKKKYDQRREYTNVWKPFFDGQRMIPDLEKLKQSENQTESTMYLPNKDFTIGTAKSCTITGETGSSATVNLSWATRNFSIKTNVKQFQNNELSATAKFANDLYMGESSIWNGSTGLESIMVAYLDTNRTYINALSAGTSGTRNTWSGAPNYEVETTNANRGQFWNFMVADMQINNYSGMLWDICSTWSDVDALYYSSQGEGNATNTSFQFANLPATVVPAKTNLIAPAGYHNSERYIVPEGGVASLFWNNPLNKAGYKSEAGEWTVYQSQLHPEVWYDVFITNACADTTADGGTTQDAVINYEFSINYSLTKQPISTANETPIFKYVILTA